MKICDFVRPELERFRADCNFTDDEGKVFECLAKGYTLEYTAELCSMGVSTIKRIKNKIWAKIERITGT